MISNHTSLGKRKHSAYSRLVVGLLTFTIFAFASLVSPAYGLSPVIVLSPPEGLSAITITGADFHPNSAITVYWDGQPVPTVPLVVVTDDQGSFTCLITALNQTGVGDHDVQVEDAVGNVAVATFTVIDVTGPQGESGLPGTPADGLSPGYLAGWFLVAAAIGSIMGVLLGRRRGEDQTTRSEVPSLDI